MTWQLERSSRFTPRPGPLLLVVMDGVGVGQPNEGNAVFLARTKTLDRLQATCSHLRLAAHGVAVGMPSDADMGNSEVGHNALGCGRIFDQGAKLVDGAIASGALFEGDVWRDAMARCAAGGALHLIGLLSDGNVHSHIDHLFALIERAAADGAREVYVHALLDGRDVEETSALAYVDRLEALLSTLDGQGGKRYRIASGGGRMVVTMDRYEADWSVVERGWKAHVLGQAEAFPTARAAIEALRQREPGIIDQYLPAFTIVEGAAPVGPVEDGDCVLLFNFRGDRAIELSRAFEDDAFTHFDRHRRPAVLFAGMMQYDGDLLIPRRYLVQPPAIARTLGQYLVHAGVTQLAIAETQKYGHVTYFWNGNATGFYDPAQGRYFESEPETMQGRGYLARVRRSPLETYIEVPSDVVPFDQRPWMKAAEVTDILCRELRSGRHRFARVNYANGDMVGHTGDLESAIIAVSVVDRMLARLVRLTSELDGLLLVTADHGNADEMYMTNSRGEPDATGGLRPKTSHTLNPVPFILFDPRHDATLRLEPSLDGPGLSNVAATVLELLGFEPPADYRASLLARR